MTKDQTALQSTLDSLQWRNIGPFRGGRVVAVAGDVTEPMTFYMGACAGGVWKTEDGGVSWRNVSDGFFNTAAIGALAVSESDPNVIYAGTGETSIRNQVSHGDGVYKSDDAGRTWRHLGLSDTRYIGKIQIHPEDPDTVYVGALGHAFGPNEERGVFRSTDGGESWEKVLHVSPNTGCHDVSMDRNNPRILYAVSWQVQRYPHILWSGGWESGLWRSFDGGDTWEDITRNYGLPQGMLGKAGIVASPAQPGRVYAVIEAVDGAVFRSDDYGDTWERGSEQSLLRTRPWYYMHITADPADPDTVWVQNYQLWKSIDGGKSFDNVPTPHGDDHALWIDPYNTDRMIEGNDGGACVTFNGGRSWSSIYNQPTGQFYHVTTDNRFPYTIYGSQQDNTAMAVPSMSIEGAIHERDLFAPGGGESGYIGIKPDDEDLVVASGPQGRRAYDDIMTLYNRRTGQVWNNTVWPELWGWGVGADVMKYRFQWTFPIMFSKHDPDALYVASQHVHRSYDLGASFEVVSPDLTRNDPEKQRASGGPITRDNTGAEIYCVIFALEESLHEPGVFWAGTDDGRVHITRDNCGTWEEITPPDMPEWTQISIIDPSPHDPGTAYIAAMRYKMDDNRPFIYKTTDYGKSWTKITGGIPDHEFIRVVREDPNRKGLLYAGSETGLYISFDDGANWERINSKFPVVPVYDLIIKNQELIVASHGRGFWIIDDLSPLHQFSDDVTSGKAHLYKPKDALRMRVYGRFRGEPKIGYTSYARVSTSIAPLTGERKKDGSVTTRYLDSSPNPELGAAIHFQLNDDANNVELAILDKDGNELRSFSSNDGLLPTGSGAHRFQWDLRLEGAEDVRDPDLITWNTMGTMVSSIGKGPMVIEGEYQVRLTVDGEEFTQPLLIKNDPRLEADPSALVEQFNMLIDIRDVITGINRLIDHTSDLRKQAIAWHDRTAGVEGKEEIASEAEKLIAELDDIRPKLIDVNIWQSQLYASGLHEKLNALFESVDSADQAPPKQAREVFEKLGDEMEGLQARISSAQRDASVLSQKINAAGIPIIGVTG
ncbi:MAG: glycosyl hydrolase [Sphaerobacteraceae bacterium]|nr:MAG: glycosyl hydrolase [Sphaerobacteraceae bacterium]